MKFQQFSHKLSSSTSLSIRKSKSTIAISSDKRVHLKLIFTAIFGLHLVHAVQSLTSSNKNWKIHTNDFISPPPHDSRDFTSYKDSSQFEGGTKWASASQEAYDELHDAEILRAIQQSIAEWEERKRIKDVISRRNHSSMARRPKRSQPEKADAYVDADSDNKEANKVCYSDLGCFEEAGYIDLLPNSPEEVNTRYLMYNSRRSRGDTPLLDVSAQNISSLWEWVGKAFNVSAPTKVIIHGFGSDCSNVWVYEMRSALMSVEDCNIICVDWENGATIPNYVRAAANTRLVGKQVAILLSGLEKYVKLSLRNVHVIGFSLGAHVAGFAGSELKNLSRITGLDPAGPLFESQDRRVRLDSMDAQFVDVIHSNGENLILGGLGAWQPMGHVDFYPNGGRMQKGCTNLFVGAVSDMIWSANEVYGRSLCNHRRAYKFFTDSVSPKCQFPAVPCESYDHFIEGKCFPCENLKDCSNMGYYADKFPGRGTLFLLTREEEPFCANQYMVKIDNSPFKEDTDKKSITFGKLQIILIGDLDLNETFTITQKKDEKLIRGESVSRILVPHPALQNFLKIQITYIAYKGWLSSGEPSWRINKITLTNSYGHVLSSCKKDLELESGIPVILQLVPKDCSIHDDDVDAKINHTTKLGHDIERKDYRNQTFNNFYPQTQVVRLGNEILSMNNAALHSVLNSGIELSNISSHNSSQIGVGVTEYLSNPWTQRTSDLYESSTGIVLNNLDNINYDNGEGRLLVDRDTRNQTVLTKLVISNNHTSSFIKSTPYEFVTEHLLISKKSPELATRTQKEITEPVLKPKPSLTQVSSRPQNSHNTNRPSNGKSINVNHNYSVTSNVKRSSNVNTTRIHSVESIEFPDLIENSGRAFKKSSENEHRNSSTTQSFVIQFLPQKLVSFLEQAERYARMAFSPFISSQEVPKTETRRVRTFNLNSHINSKEINNRQDMNVEESKNIASSSRVPAKFSPVFPYPFHIPNKLDWQPISQYQTPVRKYIPFVNTQSKVMKNDEWR